MARLPADQFEWGRGINLPHHRIKHAPGRFRVVLGVVMSKLVGDVRAYGIKTVIWEVRPDRKI